MPWCWERLKAGGEGDNRGWDGWMASPTWRTWVWVNSRSWWWTGRPGMLRSMGSQRVGHDWATELNWLLTGGFATAASLASLPSGTPSSPPCGHFHAPPEFPPQNRNVTISLPHINIRSGLSAGWEFFRIIFFKYLSCLLLASKSPSHCSQAPLHPDLGPPPPSLAPLDTLLQAHCIYLFSPVQPFVTPWTVACQAPLSMEFSRQKYHSGWSSLSPGALPNPGAKPESPALQVVSWPPDPSGKPAPGLSVLHNFLNILPHPCLSIASPYAGISFLSPPSDRIWVIFHSEGQKSSSLLRLPEPDSAGSWNSTCRIKIVCSVVQSCLTPCDPVDCSPVGYSVHEDSPGKNTGVNCHALLHGIFPPRDQTHISCCSCNARAFFTTEAPGRLTWWLLGYIFVLLDCQLLKIGTISYLLRFSQYTVHNIWYIVKVQ